MKGYTIQHSINLLEDSVEDLEARPSGGGAAADVSYDNTTSHLTADDVQDAIDELNGDITEVDSKIVGWGTPILATADELAAFVAANDTYTAPATGLLFIECKPTQNAENYLYVTNTGGQRFSYSENAGNNNMLVIPVTQGDVLTISTVLKCTAQTIFTFPFALSAPAPAPESNTRKRTKK